MAENDGLDFGKGIEADRVSEGGIVEGKVGDEDVLDRKSTRLNSSHRR